MIVEPGINVYLASIIFCAIIATGYSRHLAHCSLSGKASEAAVKKFAESLLR